MSNRKNLSQASDEIVDFLAKNPTDTARKGGGGGHDVSNEPRVPKGNPDGGRWTSDDAGGDGAGRTSGGGVSGTRNRGSASAHNGTVTIVHPDGTVEIRKGGSRAWRNNNPGNIKSIKGTNVPGAIGSDGAFVIFPDEATGTAAQEALLQGPYAGKTIDQAVEKWAPQKDGNNVAAYQDFLHRATGLAGDRKIGDLNPQERQRLMGAQRKMEGWQAGTVTHQ